MIVALGGLFVIGLVAWHSPGTRSAIAPFLAMPPHATAELPALLSQTGAFADVRTLTPEPGLIPYEVNTPLWSDGATKRRWLALPSGSRIAFAAEGEWGFPAGTVFVKHFAIALDEREPARQRPLETRLLVRSDDGGVYGVTYRWRADESDADLLAGGADEDLVVRMADGGTRQQRWHYPSREECLRCHTAAAGHVLGVSTRQLNRDRQLLTWSGMGLFDVVLDERAPVTLPRLVALDDPHASAEQRVRSYLDANCAFCHRPGAVGFANFDARAEVPLADTNLVGGAVVIDHGIDRARNLAPKDPWRSMLLVRMEHEAELRMPPLARARVDHDAVATVRTWIAELPGRQALAPPALSPAPGRFAAPVLVKSSHPDAEAVLRYTRDGSVPDKNSPIFTAPLEIAEPTTLRVRASREGHAASIVTTGTYLIEAR